MDRATAMIALMLFAVAAVGLLTVIDLSPATPTGMVVGGPQAADDCAACTGNPVCAGKDGVAANYESACDARCDGARILSGGICERIPRAY